jgi:hypothetical protein
MFNCAQPPGCIQASPAQRLVAHIALPPYKGFAKKKNEHQEIAALVLM